MAVSDRSLRDDQKAMTRERFLEAGRRLFTSQGYGSTSTDQITAEAGTSRATFYLHFSGKPSLLSEIFQEQHVDPLMRLIDKLGKIGHSDLPALAEWIREYAKFYKATRSLMRSWMQAESQEGAELRALSDTVLQRIVGAIADQVSSAHGSDVPISAEEARLRAMVMFAELERYCYYVNIRHMNYSEDRALDIITASWAHLISLPAPAGEEP